MNHCYQRLRLTVLTAVLLILSTGGSRAQEMTFTTQSDEARRAFEEGLTLYENLRADEARERFTEAIQQDPDFALAHLFRGLTGTSMQDRRAHVQHAVERAGRASQGERLLIESVQARFEGNSARELERSRQLAQMFPRDPRAQYHLSGAYRRAGQEDRALEALRKTTSLDPEYAPAYNDLGYTYMERGDYDQAEEAFQNYVRLLPDEANPHDSMADFYAKTGRYDDAIAHYQMALERNPRFSVSQLKIGDMHAFQGRYDEAREAYRKAMEAAEAPYDRVTARHRIAESYLYEGRHAQAAEEMAEARKAASEAGLSNRVLDAHAEPFLVYLEHGDLENAERELRGYRKALRAANMPPAVQRYYERRETFAEAMLAAKKGRYDTARAKAEAFRAAVEQEGQPQGMQNYHQLLGLIEMEQGRYDQAAQHLRQADQQDPYVLYQLGVAEERRGNRTRASELFDRAANWNEHSVGYALVRERARQAARGNLPTSSIR